MNRKTLKEVWKEAVLGKYLKFEIAFFALLVVLFHFA